MTATTLTREEFIKQAASNRGIWPHAFQAWLDAHGLEVEPCPCNGKVPQGLPGHRCGGWRMVPKSDGMRIAAPDQVPGKSGAAA